MTYLCKTLLLAVALKMAGKWRRTFNLTHSVVDPGYNATVPHTFARVVGHQKKFKIAVESCSSCAVSMCNYDLKIWQ